MRKRRVVITSIGVVNPAGIGKESFWETVSSGTLAIGHIGRFEPERFPVQVAGTLVGFRAADFFPRRLAVKTDTFIHYSLTASKLALADAQIDLAAEDPYRIGIFFGKNSGGWDISERGWYEYHQERPQQTNSWQATAWFPAGAQGFVSIFFGIKGYSKSFVCDCASGAYGHFFCELVSWKRDMPSCHKTVRGVHTWVS